MFQDFGAFPDPGTWADQDEAWLSEVLLYIEEQSAAKKEDTPPPSSNEDTSEELLALGEYQSIFNAK
jgi:hypothetical protein